MTQTKSVIIHDAVQTQSMNMVGSTARPDGFALQSTSQFHGAKATRCAPAARVWATEPVGRAAHVQEICSAFQLLLAARFWTQAPPIRQLLRLTADHLRLFSSVRVTRKSNG